MSDIMTSIGLDITDFKNSLNQLNESSQKMAMGMKGNMLALGAGVLGVGSIVYTFAKQTTDDFDKLIASSQALSEEFKSIATDATFSSVSSSLDKSLKLTEQLTVEQQKSAKARESIVRGYAQGFALLLQGKGLGDAEMETQQEISRQYWERVKLMQKVQESSAADLVMSDLKLNGTKAEVAALERKIKLDRESAAIVASGFDAGTKQILLANAEKIAANEAEKEAREEAAAMDKIFADEEKAAMTEFYSEQEKLESEAAKQREHDRDQKAEFLKEEEAAAKKLQDAAKKQGEEIESANKQMQAAEQQLVDLETDKLSLKDQSTIQAGKLADAEFKLSKAAKGTSEWYERSADVAKELLKLENIRNERAKSFSKSTASGRKFDREQEKQRKQAARARAREDKYDASPAGQKAAARRAANGAGGPAAPRPMMQPNAPAAPAAGAQGGAVAMMQVANLVVGELKSK